MSRPSLDVQDPIPGAPATRPPARAEVQPVDQHIVEIVSDSGEGAQTCGQLLATVSAKMGNGVWTVEIIPAEIEPPQRSRAGASGNRVRIGSDHVSNMGDTADAVIAFNEQVLYSRIDVEAYRPGTRLYLDDIWSENPVESVREQYEEALADFRERGFEVVPIPMERACRELTDNPRRGKNIWALGLLTALYDRDLELTRAEIARKFTRKGEDVVAKNLELFDAGYRWALENLETRHQIPVVASETAHVVMNGNQAIALGAMAAGIELCSMYPITPATSVSHYLAGTFEHAGGFVHQAEDEIAAVGFAIGASYAGKTAMTVTSGPGLALKTELLGLAVMTEVPLVVVVVQRGGPSTGLPTKVEQGDLMAALYAQPGDAPKIIMAPATIEECFHMMVTARRLAEEFRGPVYVLTDTNLATGQQPYPRPEVAEGWLSPPLDQADWDPAVPPYAWDEETGLSSRPIPGQRGGAYALTGLTHDEQSHVAYESAVNQQTMALRSRKLATLFHSLAVPEVYGDADGDLLVVGWGSTHGAIQEAVDRVRSDGARVGHVHLRFLSPTPPGLEEIFARFERVMTVEINYGDDPEDPLITPANRRYSQLAWLLRARTLTDVDAWSRVPGQPLPPGMIEDELRRRLSLGEKEES